MFVCVGKEEVKTSALVEFIRARRLQKAIDKAEARHKGKQIKVGQVASLQFGTRQDITEETNLRGVCSWHQCVCLWVIIKSLDMSQGRVADTLCADSM
jgi:hypothetical protein